MGLLAKKSGLEGLFKDKMSREDLKNLRHDYLNPVFKNGMRTCTIKVPSGPPKEYEFDEKQGLYIKKL